MTAKNNFFTSEDTYWMQQALSLAHDAARADEVPVGAVIVKDEQLIGSGFNQPISTQDPTAHAEIVAMRSAAKFLNNYRLVDTTLYVTLEPCAMCAGAMLHARIKRLIYAASDPKAGAIGGVIDLYASTLWNHQVTCAGGLLAEPCGHVLREFFKARR